MSKCDELKRKYSDVTGPYYGYNEVNEAIAELNEQYIELQNTTIKIDKELTETKKKLHDAEMAKDDAEAANTEYRLEIEKLKADNESIGKALMTFEKVAAAKLRATRRALWLARAERAKDRAMTCDDFAYLGDTERDMNMALARTWMKCRLLKPSEWLKVWQNVERKCRAKVEEYK